MLLTAWIQYVALVERTAFIYDKYAKQKWVGGGKKISGKKTPVKSFKHLISSTAEKAKLSSKKRKDKKKKNGAESLLSSDDSSFDPFELSSLSNAGTVV